MKNTLFILNLAFSWISFATAVFAFLNDKPSAAAFFMGQAVWFKLCQHEVERHA